MPYPNKGESEKDFVSRGMAEPEAIKSFPDSKQRAAFLYSRYKEKGTKKSLSPQIDPAGNVVLDGL